MKLLKILFISLVFLSHTLYANEKDTATVHLTVAEKQWIEAHPLIKIAVMKY